MQLGTSKVTVSPCKYVETTIKNVDLLENNLERMTLLRLLGLVR